MGRGVRYFSGGAVSVATFIALHIIVWYVIHSVRCATLYHKHCLFSVRASCCFFLLVLQDARTVYRNPLRGEVGRDCVFSRSFSAHSLPHVGDVFYPVK